MKSREIIRKFDKLQVVEKKAYGMVVGYVVGWWVRKSRWGGDRYTFRSFREGVLFPDKATALNFRNSVEDQREILETISYTTVLD